MQRETIAPRLVTTDHCRLRREAQPNLRTDDFVRDHPHGGRWDLPDTRAVPDARTEPQLPGPLAQLERQQQTRRRCATLTVTGHGHHRYAPFWNHIPGA